MKCKQAARLMVRRLLGSLDAARDAELERHLRACPRCPARLAAYQRVRDTVRALEPPAPPEQMQELIEHGIREALGQRDQLPERPARPSPERSAAQRAAVFVCVLSGLLAVTAAVLWLFRGEPEPMPPVGEIALAAGSIEVRTPGMSRWREAAQQEFLAPGTQLRTGPDSLLKVRGEGAEWWLPGMSALALERARECELLLGRLYVRCDGSAAQDVRLVSDNGTVTCRRGEFTVSASQRRLRVGCVSGAVEVEGQAGPTRLDGGRAAMVVEGEVSGPVRPGRPAELAHWLKAFDSHEGRRLSARQLASVPLTPEAPVLPPDVRIARLDLDLTVRGPLVRVLADAVLEGPEAAAWEERLLVRDAALPPPLPGPGGAVPEHHGGGAVCLLRNRNGFHALGLNLTAWTRQEIGELRVRARGTADGGIGSFDCPTLGGRLRRPEPLDWSAVRAGFDPSVPLVFEFEFGRAGGVDLLAGGSGRGEGVLLAWRPDPRGEDWFRKGRRYLIAFDASGDFGPGGRASAHEVLEGLLARFPPGAYTGLVAYDDRLKLDPDGLMRHHPTRVEVMLERLWNLGEGAAAGQGARELLPTAMDVAGAAGEDGLLVFVTGRGALPRGLALSAPKGLRVDVLQVGADAPGAGYRDLCARAGGVALALPGSAAPQLSVLDFLANLDVPALRAPSLVVQGGDARLLPCAGSFANQPVAAFVRPPEGAEVLKGRFRASAAGRGMERGFELAVPSG